jgi:solute carrier family 25 carnitine/acylcarnitine transporter 20/29
MAFANCPIELLKVRLQVQDTSRPIVYRNIWHCAVESIKLQGFSGVYRGFTATLLRDIPSFAGYFGTYEVLTRSLYPRDRPSVWPLLLAGGLAGFGAWIPCYPQDVIKSRMQSNPSYRSSLECARHIYAEAGWRGFWRGMGPTMARAFPANAATFFGYEVVKAALISEYR